MHGPGRRRAPYARTWRWAEWKNGKIRNIYLSLGLRSPSFVHPNKETNARNVRKNSTKWNGGRRKGKDGKSKVNYMLPRREAKNYYRAVRVSPPSPNAILTRTRSHRRSSANVNSCHWSHNALPFGEIYLCRLSFSRSHSRSVSLAANVHTVALSRPASHAVTPFSIEAIVHNSPHTETQTQ